MTNDKLIAYVFVGAPTSGKSTFAKKLTWDMPDNTLILERDILREEFLEKDFKESSEINFQKYFYSLDKQTRNIIERKINDKIKNTIDLKKYNLILSNTNINRKHRDGIIRHLKSRGYEVHIRIFNPSLKTLLDRNINRKDIVDQSVVVDMFIDLQKQLPIENSKLIGKHNSKFNLKSDKCILVDLDGTIAHIENNTRTFYCDDCSKDIFDDLVFTMANAVASKYNCDIVFLTGRSSKAFSYTLTWLHKHLSKDYNLKHGIDYHLLCRKSGDFRKDYIIKEELYSIIEKNYSEVLCVFDDRPSVVSMWYDKGLKVIALGDQRKQF